MASLCGMVPVLCANDTTLTCETATEVSEATEEATVQIEEDDCPLCLDAVTNGFRTPCGHVFCAACLAKALIRKDSCPVCRRRGMHKCASPKRDCPLCIAGHKPGVVVPHVFATVSHQRSQIADMEAREATVLVVIVLSLCAALMLAGALCEMGTLSVVAFLAVCVLATLANFVLLSGVSVVSCCRRLLQLMRRDPGTLPAVEREMEAL